jgi:hypothetical protein
MRASPTSTINPMSRTKFTGILFLLMAICGVGTASATAIDFFALQNANDTVVTIQSENLENMVLVFTVKFAVTLVLFWLGIRKFELVD